MRSEGRWKRGECECSSVSVAVSSKNKRPHSGSCPAMRWKTGYIRRYGMLWAIQSRSSTFSEGVRDENRSVLFSHLLYTH